LPFNTQQIKIGNLLIEEIKAMSADDESFVFQLLKKIGQPSDKMDDFHLLQPESNGPRDYNKLLLAYYLLPITYYLLPITYYLLPITYYLCPKYL
jgi:hypothetical protein